MKDKEEDKDKEEEDDNEDEESRSRSRWTRRSFTRSSNMTRRLWTRARTRRMRINCILTFKFYCLFNFIYSGNFQFYF